MLFIGGIIIGIGFGFTIAVYMQIRLEEKAKREGVAELAGKRFKLAEVKNYEG